MKAEPIKKGFQPLKPKDKPKDNEPAHKGPATGVSGSGG
jgi:hypothetical protein